MPETGMSGSMRGRWKRGYEAGMMPRWAKAPGNGLPKSKAPRQRSTLPVTIGSCIVAGYGRKDFAVCPGVPPGRGLFRRWLEAQPRGAGTAEMPLRPKGCALL